MTDLSWLEGRRICVVGASGFLGRPTARRLRNLGARVTGVSRRKPDDAIADIGLVEGDIGDEAVMREALTGAEGVVYLAGASLPASADADVAGEVEQHVRVPVRTAECAAAQGVARFVFASSGGTIYGIQEGAAACETDAAFPLNAYGASKLAVESYLRVLARARGLSAVSLRIANPFGEHQSSARGQGFVSAAIGAALSGAPLSIWGDGSVVRDYVHVDDVVEALVSALVHRGPGPAFNIGSGEGRSLTQVVEAVEAVSGSPIDVRYEPGRVIDVPVNVLDVRRAASELDWRPSIAFEEGLRRTFLWRQRERG